uniref:Uncharacterized protein n=1 Tax=Hemiselmis andersenii TaxID=464988 RepID=A0A6T8J476_HEMAN|mmetsp:Transcript_58701/g.141612  ORF Transcript_58701/g.141612 Transcript_58701/m.141612 type:complete len:214 (+) Transcript_58701:268-909(+)
MPEFYYNMPQRQRRPGRDGRPNAVNRDVPAFLVYPDGSHSLGVVSSPGTAAGGNPSDGDRDENQDPTQAGTFVVWADPPAPLTGGAALWRNGLFYVGLSVNLVLSVLILADSVRAGDKLVQHISSPPLELATVSFVFGIVVKLMGGYGVFYNSIRHITMFIAATLLLSILSLMWLSAVSNLSVTLLDLALIGLASSARSSLMGRWFAARSGNR